MKKLITLLALAAACSPERAAAPTPAFLVGEVPTSHLIGDTPTFTYSAADGGFTVRVEIDRGVFTATHQGRAGFFLLTGLALVGANGASEVLMETVTAVSGLKASLADPRPDPLVAVEYFVRWDGKDANGNTMTGTVRVSYGIALENRNGAVEATRLFAPRPVTGFFDLVLVDIP